MALFRKSKPKDATPEQADSEHPAFGDASLEARTKSLGVDWLSAARKHKSGALSSKFWSDKLMNWTMKDEAFKVQLFRFVDVYPALRTAEQVHEHLIDYLSQPGVTTPPGMGLGLKAGGLLKGTMSSTIASQITGMGKKFIAGVDAQSALPQLEKLWNRGLAFSVDLLGEVCVSDAEAEAYRAKYLDLVENLPEVVRSWPTNERLETDHLGPIPRTNISIKISALHARTDPIDFEGSLSSLLESLRPILEAARDRGVFINFDMEHHQLKDLTLELFMRAAEEIDFPAGLAMQAYLRSADRDVDRLIAWSKRTGRQVTARLVKGAYWDYETIHAEQMGWPVPVWSKKADTDACFERVTKKLIEQTPKTVGEGGVKLALGSHNVRSIALALALLEKRGLPSSAIELQMLHGMADELKGVGVDRQLRIREYVPVGEMIPGMAYLVRRLLENTSNESWLRGGFMDDVAPQVLLASPHDRGGEDLGLARTRSAPERHALSPAVEGLSEARPFFTEPVRDFSDAEQRRAFVSAIEKTTLSKVENDATIEEADEAVRVASAAFRSWRDTEPLKRAEVLIQAANRMRARRDELAAVIIRENGKPWRDADADVCEAIDFLDYYARCAPGLFTPRRLGRFVGELDEVWYQPRGVAVVISPWNFPLAICTGMASAALVTGNTVIVKPAEQTPFIAKLMCEILWESGAPKEALQFLPGLGETVGARLVRDPRVALIAFTGSKAVGLDIIQASGITSEAQTFVKKVVCEMGGKNAIIIDASADLDEAVLGVRQSAVGFSGQKCSACSRVIVLESAHDHFLERLVESTRSLVIGDPREPGTDVGPVIDEEAAAKIRSYIEIGRQEGKLELALPVPEGLAERVQKPYVGPHIFSNIRPEHRLAKEEIFGPVLSVMKAASFEEALEIANGSSYKLTGGVFSRKPAHLQLAKRELRVGNLYLNRGITGALVGRQPFGGFGLSGMGSKAGGHDYLLQFVEPRACAENTMRRGFAPGLE